MKNKNIPALKLVMAVAVVALSGCASIKQQYGDVVTYFKNSNSDQSISHKKSRSKETEYADATPEQAESSETQQASAQHSVNTSNASPSKQVSPQIVAQTTNTPPAQSSKRYGHHKAMQDIMAITPSVSSGQSIPEVTKQQAPVTTQQAQVSTPQTKPQKVVKEVAQANQIQPAQKQHTQKQPAQKKAAAPAKLQEKPAVDSAPQQTPTVAHHKPVEAIAAPDIKQPKLVGEDPQQVAKVNRLTETEPTAAGIAPQAVLMSTTNPMHPEEVKKPTQQISMSAEGWILETGWAPKSEKCRLTTDTFEITQNDYSTQLWLDISSNQLSVVTSTNVNIRQKGVGIQFDGQKLIPFSANQFANTAVVNQDLSKLLLASNELNIYIGGNEFNGVQQVSIPLQGLKQAFKEYKTCR